MSFGTTCEKQATVNPNKGVRFSSRFLMNHIKKI